MERREMQVFDKDGKPSRIGKRLVYVHISDKSVDTVALTKGLYKIYLEQQLRKKKEEKQTNDSG
jgi:hypothetical protein